LRHRRTADPCARYVQGASDLDEDAAALLAECNGDVEKARTSYIGYSLAYLEEAMPELYDALKTDPLRPDAHAALVELELAAQRAREPGVVALALVQLRERLGTRLEVELERLGRDHRAVPRGVVGRIEGTIEL
jgi:hypothetical protein